MAGSKERVCVIGAGPSGTAVLRAFQSAASKGVDIPEVVCFEKQGMVGGLWNYSWRTGVDEFGQPLHNGMYRYLWSNGPKECLEFADYTFEEHFGKPIPSYPPREVLCDYIKGRLSKAGVDRWVKTHTVVRDVSFSESTNKFTVVSRQLQTGVETKEDFDYVLACNGHFSTPNQPEWPGFSSFEGRILHAHDFRDACEFTGKDILVVGTSYSAEDIASQCYKYGVKTVTLSWRTQPMGFEWPSNFTTVPLLERVAGRTCYFKGGSSKEVDAIILCTGYQHSFPFLSDSLRLKTANRLWPDTLYKGIFWPSNPRMMYIGMQDQWFTFNMFDAQAWLARDFILGRYQLPASAADRDAEFAQWRERESTLKTDEDMLNFQGDYVKMLIEMTDYPSFDIDRVVKTFLEWEHNKHENIMTFRDCPHRSVMTGTMAPIHHTVWLKALDDSMKCYLNTSSSL